MGRDVNVLFVVCVARANPVFCFLMYFKKFSTRVEILSHVVVELDSELHLECGEGLTLLVEPG